MKRFVLISVGLLGLFLLSVAVQSCSIKPLAWQPQPMPKWEGALTPNEALQATEWIDLEGWYGPEDIVVDSVGNLYCGVHVSPNNFNDGRILKITPSGEITTFCETGSWVTGMHLDARGNLIAGDTKRGLIRVNPQGEPTVLASEDERGRPLKMVNDVDIDDAGMIYFSNTSARFHFSQKVARRIIIETIPDGGLYRYNPYDQSVTTLIDSSFFGNGVAVSQRGDFVLMVDLTKYRVLKYHLHGPDKGKVEVFLDNLPGFPNGISRRKDGSFWLGFSTVRDEMLDKIHPRPFLKKVVFGLPRWMQPKQRAFGMVMHVSEEGEILQTYFDPTGEKVSEASSIEEADGYLYLGGDLIDHIGKFRLEE
ncbi:MAG: SMP-30/gluconolactonase/LRE family protein [Bacteroidota bacterium]